MVEQHEEAHVLLMYLLKSEIRMKEIMIFLSIIMILYLAL